MVRVTFEGKRYALQDSENVLEGLLRGGASVPFSCRKGTCQACMMRAVEGVPPEPAQKGLRPDLRRRGYFLPCCAHPTEDWVVARPDPAELYTVAAVHDTERLAPDVVRVRLDPDLGLSWRAGQFVNVRHPSGAVRSYSIASLREDDYFLELHVKEEPGGLVSGWLAGLSAGDAVEIQGPNGGMFFDAAAPPAPLLLLGTGTGLAPLVGIARDALVRGHDHPIRLFHGARHEPGLYLRPALEALAQSAPNLTCTFALSGGAPPPGVSPGRVVDVAFPDGVDLTGWRVFLAGAPEVVHEARVRAFRAGAERVDIHADPFEPSRPFMPDDGAKIAAISADPELWRALGEGPGLRRILEDFYGRVYADPRLSPFFHRVTRERAIGKQYEFLSDLLTGERHYFGLKPFNAHHWMIISDELFDYREALMERCLRDHGVAEPFIRRLGTLHETFRREIVKSHERGLVVDGVERAIEGYERVTLDVGSLCDGCQDEMPAGSTGRMHARTGELYCSRCAARSVGATLDPPAAG